MGKRERYMYMYIRVVAIFLKVVKHFGILVNSVWVVRDARHCQKNFFSEKTFFMQRFPASRVVGTGELPLCPQCSNEDVSSTGASGRTRYRYHCNNAVCIYDWYQTRPDVMQQDNVPANVKPVGTRSSMGAYKCKKCGQLKKDHNCPMQTPSPGPSKKIKKAAKNRCGKCGLIKRGHICAAKIDYTSLSLFLDEELSNIDSPLDDSFVPIPNAYDPSAQADHHYAALDADALA